MTNVEKGLRVLSFDGPALGIAAFSELFILESLASTWAWDNEDCDRNGEDIRVSEFCDMVGGTGIGGFYAILFAALNMTIGQVISSHKLLQQILFSSEQWARKDQEGCIVVLNLALDRIIQQLDDKIDLDVPFLSKNFLKCFVCVLNDRNVNGRVRALRTYRVRASTSPNCTIRQAIHATLANGIHLPSIPIQDEHFLSATIGYANPSYELTRELSAAFPKASKLACLVNLGSGRPGPLHLTAGGTVEELVKLFHSPEAVAQNLASLYNDMGPCFFRFCPIFSPECFIGTVAENLLRDVKSHTMGYLGEEETSSQINTAVELFIKCHGVVDVGRLGSLAAEDGRARMYAQIDSIHENTELVAKTLAKGIHVSIINWLTPIDQTTKLDACIRTRTESTCGWLLSHSKFIEWKDVGGIFWLHGRMGTGKTVMTSCVIASLKDSPDECTVAYYFFDFTNPATLSEEALFRSLVSQLSLTNETVCGELYVQHKQGSLQPQLVALHKALHDFVVAADRPVYIIIDALDELSLSQRKYVLHTLAALGSLASEGLHVVLTSRDELDIHQVLSGKVALDLEVESEMVDHDIITFIDQELRAEKWVCWPDDEVKMMRDTLIAKADGMFRMVACQFELLHQAQTTQDMRVMLVSLPTTLGNTYLHILNKISPEFRVRAHTLLAILCGAIQPVSLSELAALLAVELGDPTDALNIPVYQEELVYHEPQNIIGLGTSLVRWTRAFANAPVVLQLSHASIKEYLFQDIYHWFSIDDRLAHEIIARACIALLIHNEGPTQSLPRAVTGYTHFHWWLHVPSEASIQLFSQLKQLFTTFPWDLRSFGKGLIVMLPVQNSDIIYSPLTFAAGTGLEQFLMHQLNDSSLLSDDELNKALVVGITAGCQLNVVAALVDKGADVNARDLGGQSVLQIATRSCAPSVIEFLVEKGAVMDPRREFDISALHISVPGFQADLANGALDVGDFLGQKLDTGEESSALDPPDSKKKRKKVPQQKSAATSLVITLFIFFYALFMYFIFFPLFYA
ncbi:hypothetical protein DL96DRAFT_1683321 [Flagelloscypha sp. PMI_526]|nr:hypothetical protein DL96DRAFT_1683321 [Flagelloscypha sp. PMI_526]